MYSVKEVRTSLDKEPLSKALYKMYRFAKQHDLSKLAEWCEWELHGYPNGYDKVNENEEKIVLNYRTITVRWTDVYGRPVTISSQLAFIQKLPLWIGVSDLEGYTENGCSYSFPDLVEDINRITNYPLGSAWIDPGTIQGLLRRIRLEAQKRFDDNIPKTLEKSASIELEKEIENWSWKRRLTTWFALFGGIWILLEPLFAVVGEKGPLSSWGIWRYPALIGAALLLTILYEMIERISKKDNN